MLVDEVLREAMPLARDAAGGYSFSPDSSDSEDDSFSTEVHAAVALRPQGDTSARPSCHLALWQAASHSNYTLLQFIRESIHDIDFGWLLEKCDVVIQ